MSNRIPVSYAELVRSGVHALRGLGLTFSSADRGAHTLAATEAATGLALSTLRSHDPLLAQRDRSAIRVEDVAPGVMRIDAVGRSLLEMAPMLIDVLAAETHTHGRAAVLGENTPHLPFVIDIAVRAQHLSFPVICLYQGETKLGFVRGGFITSRRQVHGGALSADTFDDVAASALIERYDAVPIISAFRGDGNCVLLLASNQPDAASDEDLLTEAFTASNSQTWQDASAWLPSIAEGIRNQIPVDRPEFDFFTKCVAKIWVPTSERSRAQQG